MIDQNLKHRIDQNLKHQFLNSELRIRSHSRFDSIPILISNLTWAAMETVFQDYISSIIYWGSGGTNGFVGMEWKLGLEYVDLYLVHWPIRIKKSADRFKLIESDVLHFDIKETWKAMEECCKLGLANSIGVSNYSCSKLSKLLENATIPPVVNQVEMNVAWQQQKLLQFCKEKNILVSAWSPLGANGAIWGSHQVMQNPVLKDIAAAKDKSVAQVALRWIHEQGAIPVVKSFNKERMKENIQIFDWKFTDEEVSQIQHVPQAKGFRGERYVFPKGQYKSIEELWDGEI
ncbi:NAD(P)-linked oxidoreductase superfamily protein [Abeliophyllum distichum]|uniref:NAD(P)-linked oxidoreductase superfamily protein n=1 Tax=Abeliophyllum distichum TaxID=126358 RepID=A0ABD1PM90_9LAMI